MAIARKLLPVVVLATFATSAAAQVPITGKATDSLGQPLAKARVLLLPVAQRYEAGRLLLAGELPEPAVEAETNGAGFFELMAPEEGMWDVRVEKKGFAPRLYQLRPLLEPQDLPPAALPRAAELEVRLRDAAGKPLVARVWAREGRPEQDVRLASFRQKPWRLAPHLGRTAEDGTLRLPLAAKETWTLEVAAPEHVPLKAEVKAGQRRFDKKLQRGVALALDAIDTERSEALADTLVVRKEWTLPSVLTDAKGHAVLYVAPGEAVEVRLLGAEGHSGTRQLEAPDPKRPEVSTIELAPPRTLGGQVVDRVTREPIAGALVWTSGLDAWSTTDGAGTYRLSLPQARGWQLMAAARDHAGVRQGAPGNERRGPTIALPPASRISGVVVDGEDRPVAGVEVEATKKAGRPSMARFTELGSAWHGRTGARGRFRIGGLPLEITYELELRKPGYATTKVEVERLAGPRHDLRLVLPQGIRAAGRVVDERDEPIAGAEVRLVPRVEQGVSQRIRFFITGEEEEGQALITDADGRFTTDDLTSGSYDLEARAPGFAPASAPGLKIPEGATEMDLGVMVLGPAALIEGRVVDPAGNPIAEAAIRAKAESQGIPAQLIGFLLEQEAPKTRSQKDGSFKIEDQRPGDRVHLHVGKEGFVSTTLSGVTAPTDQPVEVVLRPGSRVLGRVVDSSGAPIPQAMVQVHSERQGGSRQRTLGRQVTTDDAGRFEVKSVAPGEVTVTVQARGYRKQQLSGLEVPEHGALEGVEFTLEQGSTVRGLVTESDGKAVIGAMVMIGAGSGFGNNEGFAQTDGEGRFEFTGVSRGPKVVSANGEGGRRATANLEVEKEEHTVDLMFEGGVEVSGRVVDHGGLPVAGARVVLSPASRSFSLRLGELADESDAAGGFRISGVPAGTYTTRATKAGRASHRSKESFEVATAPVTGLEIVLGQGATLSGQIVGLEYDDMVRVEISLRGARIGSTRPDFEGRYQLSNVPVGTWNVRAELDGGGRQAKGEITVEEGVSELTLDLEFGGGYLLTGTVLRGEEPLSGAIIMVAGRSISWNGRTTTAHDGTFSFDGLEAGTYEVSVRNFLTGLNHSREIEITGDDDLLIELATGRLAGHVRDASGSEPLEGAEITLESSDTDGSWDFGSRVRSDVQGYFNAGQVTEGTWKVTASKPGYASAHEVVEVRPGTDLRDLDLSLEPTERLRLEVVTAQGAPAASVALALLDPTGNRVAGGRFETTQGGRLEVTTAPRGSWEMLLQAGDSGILSVQANVPGDLGRLVLPPGGRLTIEVADLAEGGVARVRLTGPDGRPFRRLDWRGNPESAFDLRRGSRTLNSLAQGSWNVTVTAEDGRSWSGTVTVRAGETATLELP